MRRRALEWVDAEGLVRDDDWRAGVTTALPVPSKTPPGRVDTGITGILDACLREEAIDEAAMLAALKEPLQCTRFESRPPPP